MRGRLSASVVGRGASARCAKLREEAPLRLMGPAVDACGLAWFRLLNTSGAVVGGDRFVTEVSMAAGAVAAFATVGAALAYPGGPSRVIERLRVASGGYLEWRPGPLIPYAGASLDVRWSARVEEGAALVLADVVTAGRLARGERFRFARLGASRLAAYAGRTIYAEAQTLTPDDGQLTGWGPFACCATILAIGPTADSGLADRLAASFELAAGWGGVSKLDGPGVIGRLLCHDMEQARRCLERSLPTIRACLVSTCRIGTAVQ